MLSKYCKKCNRDLPVTSFSNCSGGNYLRPECKECGRRLAKERKILKEKYGDPPIDYVCPICNKNEANIASGGGKKYTK